ncbi:MAG: hypothetical protein QM473_01915 [Acidobacteriota bacterium]|nr:hypothetical protein [Acidobacteriota bacterium]
MDRKRRTMVLLGAALLIWGCFPAAAQDAAGEFRGTVVLRSGETLSGVIKLAEFGVVLGSGVGSLRQEYGSLRLTTAEGDVTIPARDINIVDADWANQGTEDQPKWVIERITVTRNDGSKIEGTPTWLLHCSTASVELENRQTKRVHAFPLAQKDFTPDSFIKRIVIGEAPAEAPAAPAEAPAAPAEAPAAPAEAPAAPAEAPAAPAEPAFPPVPVTCSFSFTNLGAADLERAKEIVAAASVGGSVDVSMAEDGAVTLIFVLPDVTAVPKVAHDLRFKAGADGTQTMVFEEEGRTVSSSFRTARITGSVKINVTFMIAPGASLFYSPAPGAETSVPAESIDETGKVTLEASIARGQEFVYGRTVLGEIERCIKIDIYTGEVAEISKAAYEAHQ